MAEWTKDGRVTPNGGGSYVRMLRNNQVMEFTSIEKRDEGRYECKATNDAGSSYRIYEIIVQGKG